MYRRPLKLSALLLTLASCATGPRYDTALYNDKITPQQSVQDIETVRGSKVLWGGLIINSINLEGTTQMEILGYPLDDSQRPDTQKPPLGRFLSLKPGYLETVDYSDGRMITLTGTLTEVRSGQVGESIYRYPVVESNQLYLWPKDRSGTDTRVRFGVGVTFSH